MIFEVVSLVNAPLNVLSRITDFFIGTVQNCLRLEAIMEDLDKRKNEALVAVALCTGTLIVCFGVAFALI